MAYKARLKPRFNDADSAGIIFFANAYVFAHAAFETFVVEALGFQWADWFDNDTWGVPLRKTECEHLRPLLPGHDYETVVRVERLGESSVTLNYSIESSAGVHAVVKMVHTFIDVKKRAKMPIPALVRERLEAYQRESGTAE